MLQYIFVHGWGNGPEFWKNIIPFFNDSLSNFVDLNFIKRKKDRIDSTILGKSKKIYITHSLGTLWSIKNRQIDIDALVVINGFYDFKPFANEQILNTMKANLKKNPISQMAAFWRQCELQLKNTDIDIPQLLDGLDLLKHQDATKELHKSNFPILCLAAEDDPILNIKIMKHHWSNYTLQINKTGGHSLPWSQPEWCAKKIKEFVNDISMES